MILTVVVLPTWMPMAAGDTLASSQFHIDQVNLLHLIHWRVAVNQLREDYKCCASISINSHVAEVPCLIITYCKTRP